VAAFIWLTAIAAAGVVVLGGRDAQMMLARREAETSSRPRERDQGAQEASERDLMEVARRDGRKTEATARLAAGVAHDFNDILQAVIGGLDLVLGEIEPDTRARAYAGMALSAALCGSRLTHHLLAYAGNQVLHPETIAMADFLSNMKMLLLRALDPAITVDLLVTDAPLVFADPGELQTVLRNIAFNAAQAMPGGGTLRIEARAEIADGASWTSITMTDTGTGMDPATLARAVEPFFTTKGGAGSGLGLSMAQGFAGQSGGTLRIASAPGRGTAVELRLPAPAAASAAGAIGDAVGAANGGNRLVALNAAMGAGLHLPLRQCG
jgi:signal transduction histidine kinase